MGSLPMDNHFSKTTNNHPSDRHLSYKKKVPIAIDTAKVRVGDLTEYREGGPHSGLRVAGIYISAGILSKAEALGSLTL